MPKKKTSKISLICRVEQRIGNEFQLNQRSNHDASMQKICLCSYCPVKVSQCLISLSGWKMYTIQYHTIYTRACYSERNLH